MKKLVILAIFCISLLSGCNNENKLISINEDTLLVNIDDQFDILIETEGINDEVIGYKVNKDGYIEKLNSIDSFTFIALQEGEITLTFFLLNNEAVNDSVDIKIIKNKDITFSSNDISLKIDEIISLPVELTEINKNEIEFSVSEIGIISIFDDNTVKALKAGKVTLTALYIYDNSIFSTINIIVEENKEIIFTSSEVMLQVQESLRLPIEISGIDNINQIYFEVSDNLYVIIQGDTITALKAGEISITAYLIEDQSVYATIKVIIEPFYTINDSEYWIEHLSTSYSAEETILNDDQIKAYNNKITSDYSLTKVVDLLVHSEVITGSKVKTLIESYSLINKYNIYKDGVSITSDEKQAILDNRNLENILDSTNVKYGIVTEFLPVRSYPTLYYSDQLKKDRFQETSLNVGEGVIIYHTSKDGGWYFIQAQNYYGWIEASKIGLCSMEVMHEFINATDFILITADKLKVGNTFIRMGQTLPYSFKNDEDYTVSYPTRDEDGNLLLKSTKVLNSSDISEGYLDYTIANVFSQAFKMLGIPYSWGDKYIDGRDCSSTQNAIYACFGFKMPRNTSNQSKIPVYSNAVSNINSEIMKDTLRPGSLIFSSGHVLMYIGEDENGNSYVFHNTSSGASKCIVQQFSTYTGNIIATLKLY